ncbi:hypothetical protein SBRCBS47491_006960 [Sporothrix bragantina]|uniref:Uncharacterized protein n=1 Tax=Sporothrix bragantina TaxID=671064 RepID=A0ABP0CAF1_9PEZI
MASAASSAVLATSAASPSQGYICYGNWKELCSLGDIEDIPPVNSTVKTTNIKRDRDAGKKEKNGSLTVEAPVSTGVYNGTLPITGSTVTVSTTTQMPSLSSSFPLPVPSQTDCSSNYEW